MIRPKLPRGTRALFALVAGLSFCTAGLAPAQDDNADPALEKYFAGNGAYNRNLYPVAVAQYEAFLIW